MLYSSPLRPLITRLAYVLVLCAIAPFALAGNDTAPAKSPTNTAASAAKTYKPKAGETLDQVIAKTMASSPLSTAILRQAFIEQNPQAIIAGKVPKLRKGATLVVPDHDQLVQRTLGPLAPANESTQPLVSARSSSFEERKRWVQYP